MKKVWVTGIFPPATILITEKFAVKCLTILVLNAKNSSH